MRSLITFIAVLGAMIFYPEDFQTAEVILSVIVLFSQFALDVHSVSNK